MKGKELDWIYEIDEDFYFSIYKKLTNVKEVNFDD